MMIMFKIAKQKIKSILSQKRLDATTLAAGSKEKPVGIVLKKTRSYEWVLFYCFCLFCIFACVPARGLYDYYIIKFSTSTNITKWLQLVSCWETQIIIWTMKLSSFSKLLWSDTWHLLRSENRYILPGIYTRIYPPRYASTDSPAESVDADNVSLPHSDANSEVGFRENLVGADHTGNGDDTIDKSIWCVDFPRATSSSS